MQLALAAPLLLATAATVTLTASASLTNSADNVDPLQNSSLLPNDTGNANTSMTIFQTLASSTPNAGWGSNSTTAEPTSNTPVSLQSAAPSLESNSGASEVVVGAGVGLVVGLALIAAL